MQNALTNKPKEALTIMNIALSDSAQATCYRMAKIMERLAESCENFADLPLDPPPPEFKAVGATYAKVRETILSEIVVSDELKEEYDVYVPPAPSAKTHASWSFYWLASVLTVEWLGGLVDADNWVLARKNNRAQALNLSAKQGKDDPSVGMFL